MSTRTLLKKELSMLNSFFHFILLIDVKGDSLNYLIVIRALR